MDQERLQRSTDTAGVTWDEAEESMSSLTMHQVATMPMAELARVAVAFVMEEAQPHMLARLAEAGMFEEVVGAFRELRVPDRLRKTWELAMSQACAQWQREVVVKLLACDDAEQEMEKLEPAVRLILASDDVAKFCEALEAECLQLLKAHSSTGLRDLVAAITWSPYRALGIMVARGALLLTEREESSWIETQIVGIRGDLDLLPHDKSADLLDLRAARVPQGEKNAALEAAQAALQAKGEQVRAMGEKLAAMEREIALRERRERRAREAASTPQLSAEAQQLRDLRDKHATLKSLYRESGDDRVKHRREVERLQEENKQLKAAQATTATSNHESDDEPGEVLIVAGPQPLRLIEFPKKFHAKLTEFPQQVGPAVMALLGRIAAGDAAAFTGLVKIYQCDDVVRARVAGDYRLLIRLQASCVQVLDVVNRRDLQARLKNMRASGG